MASLDQGVVDIQGVGPDVHEDAARPKRTNALAVETKVNEGTITSSPGRRLHSMAAISRAAVQDGVSRTLWMPKRSSSNRRALPRKMAVACDVAKRDRLGNVVQFLARDKRLIERDL